MQTVVISGGNGFIGSSLCRHLVERGVNVHALVNENHQRLDGMLPAENIHELSGSMSSAVEVITRVQPDTIFHLAAVYAEPVSAQCVLSMIDGNLTLGASLLFAATQCRSQPAFVNTGTYWQFDELAGYAPNTLYAATKQAFQDLLHFYRSRALIRSTTLILYDTFGANDTRDKLWQRLITAVPKTKFRLSPGAQTIHLVHIEDVVKAFVSAAEMLHAAADLGPMYTVHASVPRMLRSMVEELDVQAGLELDLQWGAVPYWEGQVLQPLFVSWVPGQLRRCMPVVARNHPAAPPTVQPHILAAALGAALLIPITWLAMLAARGWYFCRYGIGSVLGIAILVCLLLGLSKAPSKVLVVFLFVAGVLSFADSFRVGLRELRTEKHADDVVLADRSELPVVLTSPFETPQIWWYAPDAIKHRLVYLPYAPGSVPQLDLLQSTMLAERPALGEMIQEYGPFLKRSPHFLLEVGSLGEPFAQQLAQDGCRLTPLRAGGLHRIFDVRCDPSANASNQSATKK